MTSRMIENRIAKIQKLEEEKKDLEQRIKDLQDELKREMQEQKTNRLTGTSHSAIWTKFQRKRFDSKTFKADNAQLYAAYIRTIPAQRFTIA